jgi:superfamily I DNA and/or RNA helicase
MLDVQRRMHPDLALFISDMFYGGQYTSPTEVSFAQGKTLQLEHFPLPVTWIDVNPSITSPGMEIDLSNPTQRSQLAEYAAFLPHNGFANLREAKLVVEVLETLVSDGNLLQERSELETERRSAPVVGVIAFYAGQVALLHRLIEATSSLQAERLSGSEWLCRGIRVTINTVDAFQGKECPIIVLTFVRSNRRKAVGFVDDPNRLNVAISRAQKKLILVGDSMTLAKRSRDREAIGLNKDTRADNLERRMFSQLVKYVEGKGKYMRVFKLRSSSE